MIIAYPFLCLVTCTYFRCPLVRIRTYNIILNSPCTLEPRFIRANSVNQPFVINHGGVGVAAGEDRGGRVSHIQRGRQQRLVGGVPEAHENRMGAIGKLDGDRVILRRQNIDQKIVATRVCLLDLQGVG